MKNKQHKIIDNLIDKDLIEDTKERYNFEIMQKSKLVYRANVFFLVIIFFLNIALFLVSRQVNWNLWQKGLYFGFLTFSILILVISILWILFLFSGRDYKFHPRPDEILDWKRRKFQEKKNNNKGRAGDEIIKELTMEFRKKEFNRYCEEIEFNWKKNKSAGDSFNNIRKLIEFSIFLIFCSLVMYVWGNISSKQNTENKQKIVKKEVIKMDDKDKKEKPETPSEEPDTHNDFPQSATSKFIEEETGKKVILESEPTKKEEKKSEKKE